MRYGSLFSGVGGLDLAVEQVLGASCAWHSEIDPHASKVLAAHWPGVPNHGDITAIDWATVEPVDVLCGGFPCQDISSAGRGAGLIAGQTRSGLWSEMARAVGALRPRLVVVENVRALLTAEGEPPTPEVEAADIERDFYRAVLDADERPNDDPDRIRLVGSHKRAVAASRTAHARLVRAIGTVAGDLADLGYDATWRSLRASDVGAPHRRERIFLVATPADAGRFERPAFRPAEAGGPTADRPAGVLGGPGQGTAQPLDLLPTPAAVNPNDGEAFATWEARRLATKERTGNGNGFGMPPSIAVQLLPSPTCSLGGSRGTPNRETARRRIEDEGRRNLDDAVAMVGGGWGRYAAAVARWEHLTRPAPAPTDDRARLNAALPEWMMGFDAGWITDVLDRAPALRAAGNAVCRQQAAVAIDDLLATKARMAEVPA